MTHRRPGDNEHPGEPAESLDLLAQRERQLPPLLGPQPDILANTRAGEMTFPPIPPTQPSAVSAVFSVKPISGGDLVGTTDGTAAGGATIHSTAA
jgi:hypothetical protein